MPIPRRPFGNTGLEVSVLGLGGGQIGNLSISDSDAEGLLQTAIDCGINLIDTAPSYGASEERIGGFVRKHRRDDFVLSTKLGYGVPEVPDWTPECIHRGIDRACQRLGVDTIDIAHLHSCPVDVLAAGEVTDALAAAVAAGKVRVAAYSGDNEAAAYAAADSRFGSIQTSFSLCDQHAAGNVLRTREQRQLGVIAKRPVANAPWRFGSCPSGHEAELYWHRWRALNLDAIKPNELSWHELALRFCVWQPGVHSAIVGTSRPEHLRTNATFAARGPLPDQLLKSIYSAFATHGQDWPGRI